MCTEKRPREDTRRLPAVTARKRSLKGSQSFWHLDLGTPELWEINVCGLSHFLSLCVCVRVCVCVCVCVWYGSLRKLIYKLSRDLLKGHILIQEVQCRDWACPSLQVMLMLVQGWCFESEGARLGCSNNFILKPQWQNKVLLLAVYLKWVGLVMPST